MRQDAGDPFDFRRNSAGLAALAASFPLLADVGKDTFCLAQLASCNSFSNAESERDPTMKVGVLASGALRFRLTGSSFRAAPGWPIKN